jgi:tetratricopeptide (TPR) repeat protein
MKRENLLWALSGLLAGFAVGYFVHDALNERRSPAVADSHGTMGMGGGMDMAGHPTAMGGSGMDDVARLRERVEQNPDDAEAVLRLANMNHDIQNWQRARDLYSRYLELRPGDPDVLTDLGVAQRGLGELSEALQSLERAQELAPDHWPSLFNKVVLLAFELGDRERARESLPRLRALAPDNPDVERLARELEHGE